MSITKKIIDYVESLRPVIYIPYFDFHLIDRYIQGAALNEYEVVEYQNGYGIVDAKTKLLVHSCTLEEVLEMYNERGLDATFLVLKDIHHELEKPKVQTLLKSISEKVLYDENYEVSIFIISSELKIVPELEQYMTILDIVAPSNDEIRAILENFAKAQQITIENEIIEELIISFKGLSQFEISQILNLAYHDDGTISSKDKELILQEKEQFIKKSGLLELIRTKENIDDIGGLENLKQWLLRKSKIFNNIERAIQHGVDIPKGLMLIGMPGCGKSLAAKASAKMFEVPLVRLDIGKLFGKYVGESEDNMRKALKLAEAVSPCVLWIDEIEKAFSGIGDGSGGNSVTTRLFGTFLTWMQEKESSVFVVATANDISSLPPEFLRKGRFDELFSIDLPNDRERLKIFQIHLTKRGRFHYDIDLDQLVKETQGYNGADIEAIVKETIENVYLEDRDIVETKDLLETIKNTKSITHSLGEKLKSLRESMEKISIKPASK
ncbi:AAA family ATPase [Lysinibacillus boronitolerans]|uniref:AAA family ATPase n=1 Tax=Lysinibacillus boronitolerans TaxID=309788 RepID=UPI0028984854|nr:AAA family ATPase [Bacillus mobilis]